MQHAGLVEVHHGPGNVEGSVENGLVVEAEGPHEGRAREGILEGAAVAVLEHQADLKRGRGGVWEGGGEKGWDCHEMREHAGFRAKDAWRSMRSCLLASLTS
jgi:hypothetical protein